MGAGVGEAEGVLFAFEAGLLPLAMGGFALGTTGAESPGKTDAAPDVFGPPLTEPVFPEMIGGAGTTTGAETEGEGAEGEAGAGAVCAKARETPNDAHKKSAGEAR